MKWFLIFVTSTLLAVTPKAALDELMKGNDRFVKEKMKSPNQDLATRKQHLNGQNPFAVVVTCSDSRVAPEILFDQGLGDLFVIRVAGNVIGPLEMESILYAVKHLQTSCVLVMGHQSCGAVDAVLQNQSRDVPFITQIIDTSVIKAKQARVKNVLKKAIELNAEAMAEFLSSAPAFSDLVSQGSLGVWPAYYDFYTGRVNLLR